MQSVTKTTNLGKSSSIEDVNIDWTNQFDGPTVAFLHFFLCILII